MSLASLREYDQPTSATILAAAMLSLGPDPEVGPRPISHEYDFVAKEVIAEIEKSIAALNTGKRSDKRISLGQALSKELDRALGSTSASQADALSRAGQAGRLLPSIYKVIQPKTFREQFNKLGIRKPDVQKAINTPDDFEHLLTNKVVSDARETHSIFMKLMGDADLNQRYWLVVLCFRQGINQIVQSAWRVYSDDVDLSRVERPSEVLEAFALKHGRDICIGDECSKYHVEKEVPNTGTFDVGFQHRPFDNIFASFSHVTAEDEKTIKVGIAFCIDLDSYSAVLRRHGVSV